MSKPLIEHAFDIVRSEEGQISFADLWKRVVEAAELTEEQAAEKISRFYTNLMLDGRFVTLGENQWDLRSRHTFDKVHIDMRDVYSDVETSEEDAEDNEDKEYNEVFEEPKEDEDEDLTSSSDTESDETTF